MSVYIKLGVRGYSRLTREARQGLAKLEKLYRGYGKNLLITSISEGNHRVDSLHYTYNAFDFKQEGVAVVDIIMVLGNNFDVVKEVDHIHVEYDPKPGVLS